MLLKRAMVLILLLLTGCGTIAEAPVMRLTAVPPTAEDEQAPYLYYFSRLHGAFVIERADGTDGFLFGDKVYGAKSLSVSSSSHYLDKIAF
jgi:hypothetical protein